jgi:hypothetical protein
MDEINRIKIKLSSAKKIKKFLKKISKKIFYIIIFNKFAFYNIRNNFLRRRIDWRSSRLKVNQHGFSLHATRRE